MRIKEGEGERHTHRERCRHGDRREMEIKGERHRKGKRPDGRNGMVERQRGRE